ncbi:MAG: hypothetical protein H0U45_11160 [Tatlockia sp.]|nr:hypothetical protein [Tatlockia sp.]
MELSNSSLEQLVKEIVAVNHAWKLACNLFEQTSSLATSLRDLKTCKQIRLLQAYGTTQVYLAIDPEEASEPLYSVRLRHSIGDRTDAEHIPVRVAQEILSPAELNRLLRTNNFTGEQKCL